MKYKKIEENKYLIRLDHDEDLMESLLEFAKDERLSGGALWGLGSVQEVTLAHYDLGKKEYMESEFEQAFEIVSLSGFLGMLEGKPVLHLHGTFSDEHMRTFAGHISEAKIAATCEIFFVKTSEIRRYKDSEVGLHLFDL
mgnify:CR=1 FL=1